MFGFIRKLALHLKKVMAEKKEDVIKTIYCWPVFNSLRLWVKAVITFSD